MGAPIAIAAIGVADLSVTLGKRGSGRKEILKSIDFEVAPGQWLVVVGPNGAGKSTLLRAALGLVKHSGKVLISGVDAASLNVRDRARQVGYVPQIAEIPIGITVLDYVLLGRSPYLARGLQLREADISIAISALERLSLDGFVDRDMRSLSGGERQLALIARALAQQTSILVLDEPTSALDIGHQQTVLETVEELRSELGLTIVSTIHDLTLAADFGTELLMLASGAVVARGTAEEVLTEAIIKSHYGADIELVRHNGRTLIIPRR